jgi:hypothetical protein
LTSAACEMAQTGYADLMPYRLCAGYFAPKENVRARHCL